MKTKLLKKLKKRFSYYIGSSRKSFVLIDKEYSRTIVVDEEYYREIYKDDKSVVTLDDLFFAMKYVIFIERQFYPKYFIKRRYKLANIYFKKHTSLKGKVYSDTIYHEKTNDNPTTSE